MLPWQRVCQGVLEIFWSYRSISCWSEGITIVGKVKSCDVQSNGQIFFSHLFSPFQDNSQKLSRIVCLHQSWSLWTEQWKVQKYVLLLEYLKLIVNCSWVQKENTKQKEIIHLVDPRTLQNKAKETIFWILESNKMPYRTLAWQGRGPWWRQRSLMTS